MADTSVLSSAFPHRIRSRSMGLKLIVVCALALLMTIPSFFVGSLIDERAQLATASARNAQTGPTWRVGLLGSPIRAVDTYRSVNRSLKYVLLFLGLVFLTYFIFEATSGRRVHPAQYILVGTAQIIFFLLLLSLAEKIGFDLAFLVAGSATVALLSTNAGWVFSSRTQGLRALAIFSLLYTLIYLLLRVEEDALLIGALTSFLAVAAAMYFTRNIDWYSSLPPSASQPQAAPCTPSNLV